MTISEIVSKIERLSPEQREEVELLVEKLANPKHPTFGWEGGLKELSDQYTSVELQKEASKWMAESALHETSLDPRNEPNGVGR